LTANGARSVRVITEVSSPQYRVTEVSRIVERPKRSFERLHHITRSANLSLGPKAKAAPGDFVDFGVQGPQFTQALHDWPVRMKHLLTPQSVR
jgi:hypothetical protein